ncbi:MAG: serine/threonine protein kinase [Phycisphaerales bacterium]|nr:serine/threonine protein kinase [Phycisphaerales bacterium]
MDAGTTEPCPGRAALERLAAGAPDPRTAAHVDACPTCTDAVAAIRAENQFLAELIAADDTPGGPPTTIADGAGPPGYDIVREIHRGAQGVVYEAVQRATKRTVALKMLLQGAFATSRQRERFEREAELAASLHHPHVVTVYDSGITPDGRHYLALEHVDGVTLTEYLRPDGADTTPRPAVDDVLRLFAMIADAVVAAHQRGIIHRDLKPANIVVDADGEPHVLDFGLAKLVGPEALLAEPTSSVAGEFVGTFAYAAPEQVAADPSRIDTRTDVYALGVLLYEMLCGVRPYELRGSLRAVVDTITTATPRPPSHHRDDLDRDVEIIALEALEKDPADRYQSAQAMLDDVRNVLSGRPIMARQDDNWYVLRKTIRRYRVPLSFASAAFAVVVIFAVSLWVTLQESRRQNDMKSKAVLALTQVFGTTDYENAYAAEAPASSIEEVLERAAAIVERMLSAYPELAAPARTAIGESLMSFGRRDEAQRHFEAAYALYASLHRPPHPDLATSLHNLGRVHWKKREFAAALPYYEDALAMRRALYGDRHLDTARSMTHLASTLKNLGRLDEALAMYRRSLEIHQAILPPLHVEIGGTLNGLATCYLELDRPRDALPCLEGAVEIAAAEYGDDDWRTARGRHNLARCLIDLGTFGRARTMLEQALVVKRTRPDETDIANTLIQLARVARLAGDDAEYVVFRTEAERIVRANYEAAQADELLAEIMRAPVEASR